MTLIIESINLECSTNNRKIRKATRMKGFHLEQDNSLTEESVHIITRCVQICGSFSSFPTEENAVLHLLRAELAARKSQNMYP